MFERQVPKSSNHVLLLLACRTVRRKLFGRNTLIDWIKRLPNVQYAIKMCQLKLVILSIWRCTYYAITSLSIKNAPKPMQRRQRWQHRLTAVIHWYSNVVVNCNLTYLLYLFIIDLFIFVTCNLVLIFDSYN